MKFWENIQAKATMPGLKETDLVFKTLFVVCSQYGENPPRSLFWDQKLKDTFDLTYFISFV